MNLVIALGAALVGAGLAARLRQSVILGYILAGVVIGPFTPGFVGDIPIVEALADIGIILLLFAIGVQISFRDLLRAGTVATLGSTIQVVVIIGLGYLVGMALGWEPLEALFLGAVISNSSSTVLSKVLGDRGEMDSGHGKIALAWSTVQDLGTIVLVVILTALATGSDGLLIDLAWDVGMAALFLALLVPVGVVGAPWLFERVAALRIREVFVLMVAVVALGTAYVASLFGLSLALGAFVAGVVVSESDLSHQILAEVLPLRDIFAGLFFVSVGMLVDPSFVIANLPLVFAALVLILIVKGALIVGIALLFRIPARTAILTGAILAQSAEFSFLLARLGGNLDAVSATAFNTMLAGAAVSILVLPAIYPAVLPLAERAGRRFSAPSPGGALVQSTGDEPAIAGHAVICGYGRVGQVISAALCPHVPIMVIEEDPRLVRQLDDEGIRVIQGYAANSILLDQVDLAHARILIIAIPDPVATRQIVDYARTRHPELPIVVRTHSEAEREYLVRRGCAEVVLGERELALEMTRYALSSVGVGHDEAYQIVQRLREQPQSSHGDKA